MVRSKSEPILTSRPQGGFSFVPLIFVVAIFMLVSLGASYWFWQTHLKPTASATRVVGQAPAGRTQVLGDIDTNPSIRFNVPVIFKELVTAAALIVEGESTFGGKVVFDDLVSFTQELVIDGELTLRDDVTGDDITIDLGSGTIIASNVVYSVTAGSGMSVSGEQELTITNTDPGSAQNIFKKIVVGSETIEADSNTDQLTFTSGTGINLSRSGDEITFAATNVSPWYQVSSGLVALVTGTDYVGIGTTAPSNKLELTSGTSGQSGLTFTNLTSGSSAGVGGGKVLSLDSGGKVILVQDETGGTAEDILPTSDTGGTLYFNGTNWVSSTNLYHDGGSVGISTVSPAGRLHVYTNSASTKGFVVQGYAAQSANLQEWRDSNGNVLAYVDANGAFNGSANTSGAVNPGFQTGSVVFQGSSGLTQDNNNFFWNDTTNRLGLGTATPQATLDVTGTASVSSTTTLGGAIQPANGNLTFNYKSGVDTWSTGMTLSTVGNLGIGSTSPQTKLDVTGTASISSTTTVGGAIQPSNGNLTFNYKSGANTWAAGMTLNTVGYLGLGTTVPTALFQASTTSTTFPTNGIGYFDWSPSSTTVATGDLLSLNVGANGTLGNIFNVKNNGSSVFSVGQAQITSAIPHQFTAAGDISVEYDINMTNTTASFIKSNAALYLQAGEVFNNTDLTLRTFNLGNVVIDSQALLISQAATVAGKLAIGTTVPPSATMGNFYLTNSATFGKALMILNQTESTDIFAASASGTNKFVITSAGNVGIGTAVPTSTLEVGSGVLTIPAGTVSAPSLTFSANTNTGIYKSATNTVGIAAGGNTSATFSSAGVVTLGTWGAGGGSVSVKSVTAGAGNADRQGLNLILASGESTGNGVGSNLIFKTSPTGALTGSTENALVERMRLDQSGNLSIGTTSPLATFDVRGQSGTLPVASVSGQTSFAAMVVDNKGLGDIFTASSSGLSRFVINQQGKVGIGTTDPGTNTLKVQGDFQVTGACTGCSSDLRLKTNVQTLSGSSLEKLLSIKGVTFEYSEAQRAKDMPGTQLGVIAQDVEKVFPELVGYDSQGYRFVRYDKLITPTIEAIREQQGQIKSLQLALSPQGDVQVATTNQNTQAQELNTLVMRVSDLEALTATMAAQAANPTGLTTADNIPTISSWTRGVWTFIAEVTFKGKTFFAEKTEFLADVLFKGRVTYEDKDVAGTVHFEKDEYEARVDFAKAYEQKPIVTLTAENYDGEYQLKDVSDTGFSVWLNPPATQAATINWQTVMVKDAAEVKAKPVPTPSPSPSPSPSPNTQSTSSATTTKPIPTEVKAGETIN